MFPEHLARGLDAVERRGKSRVHRHLNDYFDDLLLRTTDAQGRADVCAGNCTSITNEIGSPLAA